MIQDLLCALSAVLSEAGIFLGTFAPHKYSEQAA